jgi:hypothetical protein
MSPNFTVISRQESFDTIIKNIYIYIISRKYQYSRGQYLSPFIILLFLSEERIYDDGPPSPAIKLVSDRRYKSEESRSLRKSDVYTRTKQAAPSTSQQKL